MEPGKQIEVQLGHMCNNRCVFCVSGQRTALREAFPLEGGPIVEKLREGKTPEEIVRGNDDAWN